MSGPRSRLANSKAGFDPRGRLDSEVCAFSLRSWSRGFKNRRSDSGGTQRSVKLLILCVTCCVLHFCLEF